MQKVGLGTVDGPLRAASQLELTVWQQTSRLNRSSRLQEISAIIKIGGGIDGLLNLWQVNLGRTDLYKGLACPVLSILAAGSMIVERVAKFFKRGVMTQGRGRLGAGSAETYLRVGLNLRFLLAHSEANASSAGAYATGLPFHRAAANLLDCHKWCSHQCEQSTVLI